MGKRVRKSATCDLRRMAVSALLPADYNPRKDLKAGDQEFESLRRSLATFGYVEPIVWNEQSGNLVGGHQRLKVLVAEGVTEVDCSVVSLGPDEERALNLALNRIRGDWNDSMLAEVLAGLASSDDLLASTGFDAAQVEALLGQSESIADLLYGDTADGEDQPDDDAPNEEPAEAEQPDTAQATGHPADTQAVIGAYRFRIAREVYDPWLEDLRQTVGFTEEAVVTELKRRLGMPCSS